MASNNLFSVGRDCQLVLIGPSGRVDLTHVTGFEARQLTQQIRVTRLDGTNLGTNLPRGWEGEFEIERGSSSAEDLINQIEQNYYAGGAMQFSTLYQYINETDGSVSTWQYASVVLRLIEAGIWQGDNGVKQKLDFFSSTRQRL